MSSVPKIFIIFGILYMGFVAIIGFGLMRTQRTQNKNTKLTMMTISDIQEEITYPEKQEKVISPKDSKNFEQEVIKLKGMLKELRTENELLKDQLKLKQSSSKQVVKKNNNLLETAQKNVKNPFALFGAYSETNFTYFMTPNYSKPHLGLINEDDYCDKVDAYNLAHPDNIFKEKNFFTDYPKNALPRAQIMSKIGKVLMNDIHMAMSDEDFNSRKYKLDIKINNFFVNFRGNFHHYHKIGQHFLCATQMYNHIPGHTALIRKDAILDSLDVYAKKYENKPQCFYKHMYFPPFYRLTNKEECQAFFKLINSKEYNESLKTEPIQYLVKIGHGSHKGQGVFLLDHNETSSLNSKYNYGSTCGKIKKPLIVQSYITNPLLLDMKNKFDFRLYVLIASTNPLIVYYHDGFLRVALNAFSKSSEDKATHLTNTYLANQKIDEAKNKGKKLNGMTEKQLKEYHLWSFEKLQDYLLESGKINDPNWLNNYLRPAFQKAIIHIIKMTSDGFMKLSNLYELLGFDFILDNNMDLWFIESNPSPLLTGTTKHMIYYEVVKDTFDIQYAYYRGRMKRMMNLIQKMEKENERKEISYDFWKEEYQKAIKNKLEPEYPVRKNNSFVLIMDENLPGAEAYFGLISKECILN